MSPRQPRHDVLIVDDNDDVRDAFVTLLRVEGYTVASAWGVEDALRQLREGLRPCVVLLDLHMPTLSGWELVAHLESTPGRGNTPVVVVSGAPGERAEADARGVAFLQKPVEAAAIVAAVARYCERH